MDRAIVPIIVICLALLIQVVSAGRYDWRCESCGHVFSVSPLAAALLPHRFGGRKLAKCPSCGVRSWVTPVPKQRIRP